MFNTLLHTTVVCPITPTGYIYMPMQSSVYSVALTSNIAPSGTYLLRDILAGSPPSSFPRRILPDDYIDFYGVEFNLAIINATGKSVTMVFADNSTPSLYTYFAYNGDSTYTIYPYGALYIRGFFYNNTLITFASVYSIQMDITQYSTILSKSLNDGYLRLPLDYTMYNRMIPSEMSGISSISIDDIANKTGFYSINYHGPGSLYILHTTTPHMYMIVSIVVMNGSISLHVGNDTYTLDTNSTYMIGISNGTTSISKIDGVINFYLNTFTRGALKYISHNSVYHVNR
jgi:hypothetical protein